LNKVYLDLRFQCLTLQSFLFLYENSVDATHSDGLGKFVNDSSPAHTNCLMKSVTGKNGKLHLCLFVLP